jgi:hypothetical protein
MSNISSRSPFGSLAIEPLKTDLSARGISRRSSRWQILEAFLQVAEGRAERICEGGSGLIVLVAIPGQPGTGAFYLYDEIQRQFFTLTFADQDTFHASMFDYVVQFYDLGQYVELPRLTLVPKPVSADNKNVASKSKHRADRRRFNRHRGPRVPVAVVAAAAQNSAGLATV